MVWGSFSSNSCWFCLTNSSSWSTSFWTSVRSTTELTCSFSTLSVVELTSSANWLNLAFGVARSTLFKTTGISFNWSNGVLNESKLR
ncbi:hypothetical protein SE856_01905 [Mycoplasmoides gallisepticum]|nr:hypothetical protein SE856_01905 [Mycoplasmoides gallisepticum]